MNAGRQLLRCSLLPVSSPTTIGIFLPLTSTIGTRWGSQVPTASSSLGSVVSSALVIRVTCQLLVRTKLHQVSSCDDDSEPVSRGEKNVPQGAEEGDRAGESGCETKLQGPPAVGLPQLPPIRWVWLPGQLHHDHGGGVH